MICAVETDSDNESYIFALTFNDLRRLQNKRPIYLEENVFIKGYSFFVYGAETVDYFPSEYVPILDDESIMSLGVSPTSIESLKAGDAFELITGQNREIHILFFARPDHDEIMQAIHDERSDCQIVVRSGG